MKVKLIYIFDVKSKTCINESVQLSIYTIYDIF